MIKLWVTEGTLCETKEYLWAYATWWQDQPNAVHSLLRESFVLPWHFTNVNLLLHPLGQQSNLSLLGVWDGWFILKQAQVNSSNSWGKILNKVRQKVRLSGNKTIWANAEHQPLLCRESLWQSLFISGICMTGNRCAWLEPGML